MKRILLLAGAGFLTLLTLPAIAQEPNEEEPWSRKMVTYFESLCFRTEARLPKVVALAELMEKQSIPMEKLAGIMPLDDVEDGKGYFLERNEAGEQVIFMAAVTGQDACSVAGMGISQEEVKQIMSENYRLQEVAMDDIGLQINTFYIPGGTTGAISESHSKGIIAIMHSKAGVSGETMTLSYIPPRTARNLL